MNSFFIVSILLLLFYIRKVSKRAIRLEKRLEDAELTIQNVEKAYYVSNDTTVDDELLKRYILK